MNILFYKKFLNFKEKFIKINYILLNISMEQLVNITQASKMLGVHLTTLRRWDNLNYLKSIKTLGGHRRYKLSDLINFQNKNTDNEAK